MATERPVLARSKVEGPCLAPDVLEVPEPSGVVAKPLTCVLRRRTY